ncbi:hypothetical protein N9L79_07395 [Alphaproteobacteria bacterium]|nr:hypothetical protein [Alphaproteobacteria bacterium]
MILMLFSVLFVPMVGSAKADEVLYCQSELATGLYPDNGTWRTGTFTKYRYTIKVSGDFEKVIGLLEDYQFECAIPNALKPNKVVCQTFAGETFFYDKSSKRFLYSFVNTNTYLDTDTPAIFAGTCQKF